MKVDKKQIGVIHAILARLQMMELKAQLVSEFTEGKFSSTTDLTHAQAAAMIARLNELAREAGDTSGAGKMRRKVLAMANEMGWKKEIRGKLRVDMERVNAWCVLNRKKRLDDYSAKELPALVTQFSRVYADFIAHV